MSTFEEDIRKHLDHCPDYAPRDPRGTFIALALAGEAGELGNLAKKEWRDNANHRAKMVGELSDVYNYTVMLAIHWGLTLKELQEIGKQKLLKVEQRPDFQNYGKHG